jgi:hypothetical protein
MHPLVAAAVSCETSPLVMQKRIDRRMPGWFGRQGNLYRGPPVYTNHLRDPTRTIGFVLVAVQPLPMLITPEKLIP